MERTIRLPIGPGNEGKLYAVALSPDGRRLVAGGWDPSYARLGSHSLSLVDLDTEGFVPVASEPFPDVIDSIAFSRDGARVAVGLGGANGLRVYDGAVRQGVDGRSAIMQGAIYGLAFAPDGSLVASSDDGQLRR